jgi:tripartite ATP-independent transporter DctM subunit
MGMFLALAMLLFSGYPVALILAGIAVSVGMIDMIFQISPYGFSMVEFLNFVLRTFGSLVENLVLIAVPMFIFMGTMLEKSGVAQDLLHCLQVLLRRIPGGLALSVTIMGTIMAATTGIIGASVVMMTLMALPVMMQRGYSTPLATGTIAASGTLGILIPPSIMLVIMADLMSIPVGTVFIAAALPGFLLSGLYLLYILILCGFKPHIAPPLPEDMRPADKAEYRSMLFRSFVPPILLIVVTLGSIFAGFATPTEASGVGAVGATLLAVYNGKLNFGVMLAVNMQTAFMHPPFGFALFYLKGVAPPEVTIQEIYRGIIPFVLLQLFGLALCVVFPWLVLGLPNYILGG